MHRCFIESGNWNGSEITLPPEEAHHLLRVLRAKNGDTVNVFDGEGREARAVLGPDAKLSVTSSESRPRPSPLLSLFQAVPKGQRMDFVIEKATELGVSSITPMSTERGVVRVARNTERWHRLAVSSAKQCGTMWIPRIGKMLDFPEAMTLARKCDLLFLGSLLEGTEHFARALERSPVEKAGTIGLIVGPEGDLSADETGLAVSAGAIPVSFGSLVLRVETASVYGLSVLSYESARRKLRDAERES